jgi:prephenate dehydrogenase
MFNKIAIIGTGLMGGSLALALAEHGSAAELVAYDISAEARAAARELEIADAVTDTAAEAASGADLIFLATPIGAMVEALGEAAPAVEPGAIVSDLASAKMSLIKAIEEALPPGARYVGGHPMTGSEQSGVRSARADLFRDRYYILTPTENTDPEAYQRVHSLLTDIGARVISMDPESHDRAMATISHVPHLLSLLLMGLAAREREQMKSLYTIAAGGFRDMTRIAASSPEVWLDIVTENRAFIIDKLNEYQADMRSLVDALGRGDRGALEEMFVRARAAREELSRKSGAEITEMYAISLPVPDEPGVISRVTTAVGALGINIEDISIAHPLEGETGILTLKVLGRDSAREAAGHLGSLGYRASLGKA